MNKICVRCDMEYPNHKMSCKIPVEEWRLPTAHEFLNEVKFIVGMSREDELIQFAKLHLEAQKEAILKNVQIDNDYGRDGQLYSCIDEDSIKSAYNLDNVK